LLSFDESGKLSDFLPENFVFLVIVRCDFLRLCFVRCLIYKLVLNLLRNRHSEVVFSSGCCYWKRCQLFRLFRFWR